MSRYSLSHLSDSTLLRDLASLVARDRATTAEMLANIAEVEARRLYADHAYPSMFAYCVHELRLSESAALNRIRAARAAREFPAIFEAVADGRLHLAAVLVVAPHLTPESADELLAAAEHKTRAEVEQLLAQRLAVPVAQGTLAPVDPTISVDDQLLPGGVDSAQVVANTEADVAGSGGEPAAAQAAPSPLPPARLKPIAPGFYSLQVPIDQHTHDRLRHAQALLSHRVPSGDLSQVLDRALAALIAQLERRKVGATARPRRPRESANPRHVPAHVRRAVWERDGGQCTFVSAEGRRCSERHLIEFDHEVEVARGGTNSVGNIRLRCRTHNQHGAERAFGSEFMGRKRAEAAASRERAKEPVFEVPRVSAVAGGAIATLVAAPTVAAPSSGPDLDVVPWLRALGIGAREAREVAGRCVHEPGATLEQRVRRALSFVGPRPRTTAASQARA